MSRAVLADHTLFDECIEAFRRENSYTNKFFEGESTSFLLNSFEINQEWDLGICKVSPSIVVRLPGAYSAFISKVENPEWVGTHNSNLFGLALSSIVSFITHKPCNSTRNDYLSRRDSLSESDYMQLSLINPTLTAGPGSSFVSLSQTRQLSYCTEIREFISKLMRIDHKLYLVIMQSIRMVHLSLINKREDFGLAYLLVISAIESITQNAIKRKSKKHPLEREWGLEAKKNRNFEILLKAYKEERGNNQYLKERYIEFILDYAPVESWEEYVPYPMQNLAESIQERNPSFGRTNLLEKAWWEKYPQDLTSEEIQKILGDSYKHRSFFIHRGEQPPHREPHSMSSRFFQEQRSFSNVGMTETLLPNYELMLGLAKNSIMNWIDKKLNL